MVAVHATILIDREAANEQAVRVAVRLFEEYGVDGSVERVTIDGDRVDVEVEINDPAGDVTGVGSAQAEPGP